MEIKNLERWINISASFCSLCAFMILISTKNTGFNLQIILQYLFGAVFIIAIWGIIIYFSYRFFKWGKERDRLLFLSIFLIVTLIAIFIGIFFSIFSVQIIEEILETIFLYI